MPTIPHAPPHLSLVQRTKNVLTNGKFAALVLLLPPALILFSLFVILPLLQSG